MAKKTKAELVDAALAKGIPADDTWSWKDLKAAVDTFTEPADQTSPTNTATVETVTITVNEDLVPTRNVTSKRLPQVLRLPHRGRIHL